jgi:hypothetical protein
MKNLKQALGGFIPFFPILGFLVIALTLKSREDVDPMKVPSFYKWVDKSVTGK